MEVLRQALRAPLVALVALLLVTPLGEDHPHQTRPMEGCRWVPLVRVCHRSLAAAVCLKAPLNQVGFRADQRLLYARIRRLRREVRIDHYLHYSRSQCVDLQR